jgi:transcriptional regulator with XRE-family HTH domain
LGTEMPKRKPGSPSVLDINSRFGTFLRRLREDANKSQTEVGLALGVSFQQIQKYENGTTSISLSRIEDLARLFKVPVVRLVENLEPAPAPGFGEENQAAFHTDDEGLLGKGPQRRQRVSMLNAFNRIESAEVRRGLVALAEAIGAKGDGVDRSED